MSDEPDELEVLLSERRSIFEELVELVRQWGRGTVEEGSRSEVDTNACRS